MFGSALMKIGLGVGAAYLGESIQKGAKYLYGQSGFADTTAGKWFDNLFSNEKIGSAVKGVSKELVQVGLGLDPSQSGSGGDPRLNRVPTGDTFNSRFKMGQVGGQRATFPLGNSNYVSKGLNDINVQQRLVQWVSVNSKRPVSFVEPNIEKTGKVSLKKGVIKKAN